MSSNVLVESSDVLCPYFINRMQLLATTLVPPRHVGHIVVVRFACRREAASAEPASWSPSCSGSSLVRSLGGDLDVSCKLTVVDVAPADAPSGSPCSQRLDASYIREEPPSVQASFVLDLLKEMRDSAAGGAAAARARDMFLDLRRQISGLDAAGCRAAPDGSAGKRRQELYKQAVELCAESMESGGSVLLGCALVGGAPDTFDHLVNLLCSDESGHGRRALASPAACPSRRGAAAGGAAAYAEKFFGPWQPMSLLYLSEC